MMVHVVAVVALGVLCGLWVALQLAAGGGRASGVAGKCGACREREACSTAAPADSDSR